MDPLMSSNSDIGHNGDPGVNSSFNLNIEPVENFPANVPTLPTITEQSVTAAGQQKDSHPAIGDIFPDQDASGAAANEIRLNKNRRISSGRLRNTSGNESRFQVNNNATLQSPTITVDHVVSSAEVSSNYDGQIS
jgi:hypothetical protein